MARLTFAEAQNNVAEIANRETYNIDFVYELLAAYGRARSAITKLREGSLNLAEDKDNEILQRGVVYFKHVADANKLHSTAEELAVDPLVVRYNPRYLIVSDYERLVAVDTKKNSRLDINLRDIDRDVDFFYGWTGDEITDEKTEAVADRRAADKMKDLYAEIEKVNRAKLTDPHSNFRHDLNVFFSRLLFCFFAEDTRVFSRDEQTMFTNAIKDYTQTDGSDLDSFLITLFDALDTENKAGFTSPFSKFPYVNGTIFDTKKHGIGIPKFNAQARKLILDCGNQNWAEINPDIFGSMFQSIVDEEQRSSHGQHYTSVPNIMKTIEPLFLDQLREEFDKYYDNDQRLLRIWDRISKIRIFDPACGSGNFLIIAYKELRKIEHAIIERVYGDEHKRQQLAGKLESRIKLDNFYGIEIDDFPHEIAILSLYLAKHQMNIDFEQQFGREIKLIPLKDNASIIHGDSTILDWKDVCPNVPHKSGVKTGPEQSALIDFDDEPLELELEKETWDEIYLIGNPPYLGSSLQDQKQKAGMTRVFKNFSNYKNLDFIAPWFKLGADYISGTKAQLAFVTTNSICQGEQVALLWPYIFEKDVEIGFAHTSFKWTNGARNVAGVTVAIIGLRTPMKATKYIYNHGVRAEVDNINAYLSEGSDTIVIKRTKPLSHIPRMGYGCKPVDGGHLIFDTDTMQKAVAQHSGLDRFIKQFVSGQDYLSQKSRWCLWISDAEFEEAYKYEFVRERVDAVREFRLGRKDKGAQDMANKPYQFREFVMPPDNSIIVPSTSSERREYVPIGYIEPETVVNNASFVLSSAPLHVFGIISSRMHMVWMRSVSGKLKTDYRYSSSLVYNTFPLRPLLEHEEKEVASKARNVIFTRQNHTGKTLSEMYDPDKMPEDLRQAHHELDLVVDKLYRSKPYNTDEERLADLFTLYEQMTEREKTK
ncbi:MAG: class I SAM-dependent DNA methyltransferase [Candidatus Saccharimonadales bacterium]